MTKENSKLIRRYEKLTPDLKEIIQILGVHVNALSQNAIIASINFLKISNNDGTSATYKTLRPLLAKLKEKKLVIQNLNGVSCPEKLAFHAAGDAAENNKFVKIFFSLLPSGSIGPDYYDHDYQNVKQVYKAIQAAVFSSNKFFDIHDVYQNAKSRFPMEFTQEPFLLKLFNRPFLPDLFNRLEADTGLAVIAYMINESENICGPVTQILDYSRDVFFMESDLEVKYIIAGSFLLHGRVQEFENLLQKAGDVSSWQLEACMGWAKMISSHSEAALTHLKKAFAALQKERKKQRVVIPGNAGLFFLFALLKSENKADHQEGLTYIETALKTEETLHAPLQWLKLIFQEKLGIMPARHINFDLPFDGKSVIRNFLGILILSWVDIGRAKSYIDELETIREKASAADYLWIEAEACTLLTMFGKDIEKNKTRSEKIHQKCSTVTITKIAQQPPPWEKKLRTLKNIGMQSIVERSGIISSKRVTPQRLIWVLEYRKTYQIYTIKPRLQKLSKNKKWTRGRAVALKNLYYNHEDMDGLSKQDHEICNRAIKEKTYHNHYYYGRQREYVINSSKALPMLAGHPLVFLENSLETPLELVKSEPELRLQVTKGRIHIFMDHFPTAYNREVLVAKETPSRYKVICFSQAHLKLADYLDKEGLDFPRKAEKLAVDAMASLSPIITVNSDLVAKADNKVKIIQADSTPNVHVMPWQEGIRIEFLVRPFGSRGSYFKPGRGGETVFARMEGEKIQTRRNLDLEKARSQRVIDHCRTLDLLEKVDGQWLIGDPEDALELLLELKNCKEKLVMFWPRGEKMKIRSQVSFDDFTLHIKKDRGWFQAEGSLKIDEKMAISLSRLMKLIDNASHRFVVLDDGTYLAVTRTLKERLEELKAYSTNSRKKVRFSPLAAPAMEELVSETKHLKTDKAWKDHCKKINRIVKPEIPGTLRANLRDYQKSGFKWLSQLAHWNVGACLADDMGLGKTVQALAAILINASKGAALVIAPLSVMANWVEECRNFAPTLNPLVFGPGDRQMFLNNLKPFDIVISSYGLLQNEGDKLASVDFQTIVLDEAQAIKNRHTKRSKAAMKLKSQFRIITTGTPVENHLNELWTLFNFLNPGLLGSINHFKKRFVLPIERDSDKKTSKRLKKLIQPFVLRRLKTDVLQELPEKTQITLEVEMSREEALLYEAHRLKAIENIESADDKPGQRHFRILAQLTKLRQLCCNPSLILPNTEIKSSKLKVFGDVVDELLENRHKALVFSQFTGHLSILCNFLDKKKITYQYLDGSTSVKKRKKLIKDFQNGIGDLFLISLKAGGFGLNLTAADYVIHMDPWWNPAVEDQASDRAHRIGQKRPVTIYRLVVKNSIEQKIVTLHKEKRELADSLLSGSDMAEKISAEELLTLLHENL